LKNILWSFFEDSQSASKKPLLLLGGVHGDESQGVFLVEQYVKAELWKKLEGTGRCLYVIARVNPDGCEKKQRMNANLVDLNRNLPTLDWDPVAHKERYNPGPSPCSEPENKILVEFITKIDPHFIVTAHTYDPMINTNGPCQKVAEHMAKFNGYKIFPYIGYPTPGSLGTWAGQERNIPTITLEIEKDSPFDLVWKVHAKALEETFYYAATHEDLDK
jgi:protein MpaA